MVAGMPPDPVGYRPGYRRPTREEKLQLRTLAGEGRAPRVLCHWGANSRVVVLDPALNPEGFTYAQMLSDPAVPPIIQSRFQEYWNTTIAETCDNPGGLPATWEFSVEYHNVYDAAYFGAPVEFKEGQVPATRHPFLGLDDVDAFMRQDIRHPLDNPYIKAQLAFREALVKASAGFTHLGRPGKVAPFTLGFDGPLTAAFMLFGDAIFLLMAAEPERARALLLFITEACIIRNQALLELAGRPVRQAYGGLADDTIQLISTAMLEDLVLPAHALWYDRMSTTTPADRRRSLHCCGDGTRHFKTIADILGVSAFDTGFPVDHGALRRELGPEVHIAGGPAVPLFLSGTPEALFEETRRILTSGIKEGRRFGLREGNNLPPRVPLENLHAVYQACLAYGAY